MFNLIEVYKSQFQPYEDGYIYYPVAKSGGKFVTAEEYDAIINHYESKFAWRPYTLLLFSFTIVVIAIIFLVHYLNLSEAIMYILLSLTMVALFGYIYWYSRAGHRLVKNKADIMPPRSKTQVMKDGRKAISWSLIIFLLIVCGLWFFIAWTESDRGTSTWIRIVIFGTSILIYLWVAYKKYYDGRR